MHQERGGGVVQFEVGWKMDKKSTGVPAKTSRFTRVNSFKQRCEPKLSPKALILIWPFIIQLFSHLLTLNSRNALSIQAGTARPAGGRLVTESQGLGTGYEALILPYIWWNRRTEILFLHKNECTDGDKNVYSLQDAHLPPVSMPLGQYRM